MFEPLEFLAKLAALVPPPHAHLVTYHGVLAPASPLRAAIVPASPRNDSGRRACAAANGVQTRPRPCARHPWAELLRRVFLVDVLRSSRCGGRRQILAAITECPVIRAILEALGLPTDPPAVHRARSPPDVLLWE